MASSLFFCATPTIGGMGHNLFAQAGTETSDTCAEAVKTEPRCSCQAHSRKVRFDVMDESTESRSVLQPLLIASVIRPERPISVIFVR